jgi:hypothetical protein
LFVPPPPHAFINPSDDLHGCDGVLGWFSKEFQNFGVLIFELDIPVVDDLVSKISSGITNVGLVSLIISISRDSCLNL